MRIPFNPAYLASTLLTAAALTLTGCHGSDGPPSGLFADARSVRPAFALPDGFTPLLDGESLAGWKGLVEPDGGPPKRNLLSPERLAEAQEAADAKMKLHWTVDADGTLFFDGKGDSICTVKDYTDFELIVDWMIAPAGDSGIYLRGSPQVQIWESVVGSGGLYNNLKHENNPTERADNPVGTWNRFFIRMQGERVWVWLNGVLVTGGVVMENYWDRRQPIYPVGQIELQNHGGPLWFRNICIRELTPGS
ncbi:MAG: DUF1080 domain-containing protein [Phycisphaerales bacterium]|nr:DUF1080 domain-containing protein [Phycisphaerales bacterium]